MRPLEAHNDDAEPNVATRWGCIYRWTHFRYRNCSMKKEQVVNCQFSVWYPIFKKHTIKSLILPLPQNVIDYLLDDGTLVVSGSDHNTQRTHTNSSDSDAEEDIQWSDDETTTTVTAPEFPEFTCKVLEAINALGGRVFPKLNWSAPR
ncbi:translation initiation factor eIF2 assembly protein, partial [Centroberyx affinis]|uniref:translation initiation factor eIF2 assembly protein n=1 Tax=Centroberyx affinis TaxID=166261 RepID=UPI003A5C68DE